MEKRKFTISENNQDTKDRNKKDVYTFTIPNSKIEDIHIPVSKSQKKEKKNS